MKSSNPLLITGMHRSGTSMMTRLLNLCGLHLGDAGRLLQAQPDNPAGFWENLDFVSLDDRMLARMGCAWDLPPQTVRGYPQHPAADAALQEEFGYAARNAIRSAAAGVPADSEHGAWGWKDPRASVLLSFWTQIVPSLRVVVCVRDPQEVAASLTKRNGFSPQLGLHLWRRYNEQLLDDLRGTGTEFLVTHYEAMLVRPVAELRRVTEWLGWSMDAETLVEACASIRPELRHHRRGRMNMIAADAETVTLYERLLKSYLDTHPTAADISRKAERMKAG